MNAPKRRRSDFGASSFFDQLDAQIESSGFVPQGLTMNDFQTQGEAEEEEHKETHNIHHTNHEEEGQDNEDEDGYEFQDEDEWDEEETLGTT